MLHAQAVGVICECEQDHSMLYQSRLKRVIRIIHMKNWSAMQARSCPLHSLNVALATVLSEAHARAAACSGPDLARAVCCLCGLYLDHDAAVNPGPLD